MMKWCTDGQRSTVQQVASVTNLSQLQFLIQFNNAFGTNTATANTPRCSALQGTEWFKL